ncbi:MAG: MFS transporter [Pseudonocardiaceae bacterium]|nr:MFS transporter [Pseudonocardiaceae bacterium]
MAVCTVFGLNGFVYGTWAPRVPALADQVGARVGALGLALLGASVGMIIAASFTGRLCAALGARIVVAASAVAACVVVPVLAMVSSPQLLGVVLCGLGMSVGALDVSMNIAAVTMVRRLERPIMSIFHAAFSFGGLFGSLGAAGAAASGLSPLRHFLIVAVAGTAVTLLVARAVPNEPAAPREKRQEASRGPAPMRRPVLWLLAAIALCSAIAEGASADWSALFFVSERGMGEGPAAVAYAAFSVAMGVARLFGERVERRWGADRLLVAASASAGAGLLLAVLVPHPAAGYVGFTLAGAGLAYSFPVALNMAGAVGRRADGGGGEREIGFVTTIAYSGFLSGPPLIGGLAHISNLGLALGVAGVIAALIGPAALGASAARRAERRRAAMAEVEPVR